MGSTGSGKGNVLDVGAVAGDVEVGDGGAGGDVFPSSADLRGLDGGGSGRVDKGESAEDSTEELHFGGLSWLSFEVMTWMWNWEFELKLS
jgi:hypothetical protein